MDSDSGCDCDLGLPERYAEAGDQWWLRVFNAETQRCKDAKRDCYFNTGLKLCGFHTLCLIVPFGYCVNYGVLKCFAER